MTDLLRIDWSSDDDIFTIRQRGREVAAALGFDQQDQTRVATALSEVGRDVVSTGPVAVAFSVTDVPPRLVASVTTRLMPSEADAHGVIGIAAARRLLDDVTIEEVEDGWSIRLAKRLPKSAPTGPAAAKRVRAAVRGAQVTSPLEELRAQNAELVHTLDELTGRQEALLRLNDELEETNKGVLAMYGELSEELEETNRGVVALYAELDEKGRQLVEANEAKTRFLRNVSHELRTPVNSILGLSDLLGDGELDDEQQLQVDYLRGSARSLLGLVNELLDLARAESGRIEARVETSDLGVLFGELRGTMRPVATDKGVDLEVEEPDGAELRTDPDLLTRILRNLLMNAVKFTEPGGRVRMTSRRRESGQHVEISISDTGIGIAPEHHEQVFEEFFQVPGAHQTAGTGTGLGLPYAQRLTEALGGRLELVSAPGEGSTFTVVLPAPLDEPLHEPSPVDLGHVLVVDDDEAFRHVLRGMLQGFASRVSEASDGEQALQLIRDVRPDAVLLDLRMPRLDGAGVMAALRTDPPLRDLPIVLMTSVPIDVEVRRAAEPAAALMAKSQLTHSQLISVMRAALAGSAPVPKRGV